MSTGLVISAHSKSGDLYLRDEHGKLVYIFYPKSYHNVPMASTWRGASATWVRMWSPVLVSADKLEPEQAGQVDRTVKEGVVGLDDRGIMKRTHFGGVFRADLNDKYHVHWGSDKVKAKNANVFWGLYTYVFDGPLDDYGMTGPNIPPGWVSPIWVPAKVGIHGAPDVEKSDVLDGPPGMTASGGP